MLLQNNGGQATYADHWFLEGTSEREDRQTKRLRDSQKLLWEIVRALGFEACHLGTLQQYAIKIIHLLELILYKCRDTK